ncbi:hypothetical protein GQ43DRAFT_443873 [Delitschia confertaspora ATCC 74209]|uniref:G-patch domain-containing protein n=1 Tax=Delitschia confertaspora ATCC 74209 TaxID=1513339 RepID=A0A9P4JJW8_9PLEO|nr:hypothetical protein GQ43DRAFT_443873 [Delitschia confertaspora ATCC 74209]
MTDSEDEAGEVPLQFKKPFSSGLRNRKPIEFAPATEDVPAAPAKPRLTLPKGYLSNAYSKLAKSDPSTPVCDVCKEPITEATATAHNLSIVHQISLPVTHPPLAIDRKSKGFSLMAKHGWDPEERKGLGAKGMEGRAYPVKAVPKHDTVGLGVKLDKVDGGRVKKLQNMNAKQAQKHSREEKRRAQKLHDEFYRNDEVNKYLSDLR